MQRTRTIVLFALATLAVATASSASTFLAMDRMELVVASSAVVQGEVVEIQSFWDETGRVIVTEAVVTVDEVVAGRALREVRVRTFGGEVADYHVEAIGFPRFEPGQQVLLFLQPGDTDAMRVTGYQLGHYRIEQRATGERLAVPTVEDRVRLLTLDGRAVAPPAALPLSTLKTEVRAAWRAMAQAR